MTGGASVGSKAPVAPLGQVAEAEETLELVIFAESPAGCYVNGAALQVHSSLKGVISAYEVRHCRDDAGQR